MRNIFGVWYALFLLLGLFGLSLLRLVDGTLMLLSFEGDAVHMAQIVLRMAAGETPHADFLTPLGAMAFLPIVWLLEMGFGLGSAFAYAPVLIGIFLLPALWWAGVSRLGMAAALGLGAVVLILLMSLLHGGLKPTVTASMYYNNWGWAVASVIAVIAVLPGGEARAGRIADGVVLGAGMAFLTLLKAPFAVFLLPVVVLGPLLRGERGTVIGGVLVGLVALAAITLPLGGMSYWAGYVGDLRTVASGPVRGQPGVALATMVILPGQILGSLGILAAALFLRQASENRAALLTVVLGGGFIAIAHQNWQNDPHWTVVFGLIVLALSQGISIFNRYGWPLRDALRVVAVGFLAVGAPGIYAQFQSLLIHSGLDPNQMTALLPDPRHDDLRVARPDLERHEVRMPHPGLAGKPTKPTTLAGSPLPDCQKETGLVAELQATGKALDGMAPMAGKSAIYADWVNALWLFSELEPLAGGAPWYYGGAPGVADADYLVVPLCPMGQAVREKVLEAIDAAGVQFRETGRNDLFILLQRVN